MVLIQTFGALTVTMTTTVRKALSIILSFIIFPKPYSHIYTIAIISLFSGVFLSVYKPGKGFGELLKRKENKYENEEEKESLIK